MVVDNKPQFFNTFNFIITPIKIDYDTQDIKSRLNETRNWYIVLTLPRKERKTKETLENKGMITYLPTIYVKRRWKEQVKEIQIPAVNRCVFIYATGTELEGLKGIYPTLPIEMTEVGH